MIDEYGIDDKRDQSRGTKTVISGFRIRNSRMVVASGMVIVYPVPIQILRSRFKVLDEEVSTSDMLCRRGVDSKYIGNVERDCDLTPNLGHQYCRTIIQCIPRRVNDPHRAEGTAGRRTERIQGISMTTPHQS
jgi:hypothetical protein